MMTLKDLSLIAIVISVINLIFIFLLRTDFIFKWISITANLSFLALSIVLFRKREEELYEH
jgi:hypothetical protein